MHTSLSECSRRQDPQDCTRSVGRADKGGLVLLAYSQEKTTTDDAVGEGGGYADPGRDVILRSHSKQQIEHQKQIRPCGAE